MATSKNLKPVSKIKSQMTKPSSTGYLAEAVNAATKISQIKKKQIKK